MEYILTGLSIARFKGFRDHSHVRLAPITLIYGENSVGKSSIIESILGLAQGYVIERYPILSVPFHVNGDLMKLGSPADVVYCGKGKKFSIGLAASLNDRGSDRDGLLLEREFTIKKRRRSSTVAEPVETKLVLKVNEPDTHSDIVEFKAVSLKTKFNSSEKAWAVSNYMWGDHAFYEHNPPYFLADLIRTLEILVKILQEESIPLREQRPKDDAGLLYDLLITLFRGERLEHGDCLDTLEHFLKTYRSNFYYGGSGKTHLLARCLEDCFDQDDWIGHILYPNEDTAFIELFDHFMLQEPDLLPYVSEVEQAMWATDSCLREVCYLKSRKYVPTRREVFYSDQEPGSENSGESVPFQLFQNRMLLERANSWLKEFGVNLSLKIKEFENMFWLMAQVMKKGVELDVPMENVGSGYGQLVPLIVETSGQVRKLFLIEEPETNLHPKLQATLANYFLDLTKTLEHQFIVETHSEALVNQYAKLIKTGEMKHRDITIVYVTSDENGSHARNLEFNEFGEFEDGWPEEFFPLEYE